MCMALCWKYAEYRKGIVRCQRMKSECAVFLIAIEGEEMFAVLIAVIVKSVEIVARTDRKSVGV